MYNDIKTWLSYPSTWAALVSGLTLVGVEISPDQADAITKAGIALVTAIFAFFSDTDVKQ